MQQTYARAILVLAAAIVTPLLVPAPAVAEDICDNTFDISIKVTPSTLNLQHYFKWLTIHADIYYDEVKSVVVYLNGDEDTSEDDAFECWRKKADEVGNLVARCNIKDLDQNHGEIDDFNTFTLKVEDQEGQAFCGHDEVMIVDRGPETSPPGPGPGPGGN
jgi:hypothetical protein